MYDVFFIFTQLHLSAVLTVKYYILPGTPIYEVARRAISSVEYDMFIPLHMSVVRRIQYTSVYDILAVRVYSCSMFCGFSAPSCLCLVEDR